MTPLGVLLTSIYVLMVVALPRRWAMLGVFAGICYMTQGQIVNLGGFHLQAIRMVLLAGFIRVVARGELRQLKLVSIDRILIAYGVYSVVMEGYRLGVWQEQAGEAYDILLSYFVFRCLITSWEDLLELLPRLALFIVPMTLCMVWERHTGRSVFMALGGLNDDWDRDGAFRCKGAFRAPQTAGTFSATLIPLFAGLYFINAQRRKVAVAGIIAATIITYTSNSSGPLMGYLSSLVGLAFWPLRKNMRKVRWGIVAFLIFMSLTMKASIWYLIAKIADLTGGDGWYRSYLMDQCYNHFSDWWLMGTSNTFPWAVTHMSTGQSDLCNMYVACAAAAGLGCLFLFVLLQVKCFQKLGNALKTAREISPQSERMLWSLGCVLFAHVMIFFSVTYWDQMNVVWWGFLALIASATSTILTPPNQAEVGEEADESLSAEVHA